MNKKHYLEEELFLLVKNNNDVFDFIQDFALDGLWLWDLENPEHEWMNKKFWQTLGYEPGELPYSPESWKSLVYEKDFYKLNKVVNKYLQNPVGYFNSIVRYKHKNGSILWVRCCGKLFRDLNGNNNRLLGAHQNITDLKLNEFFLEKSNSIANIGFWEFDVSDKTFQFSKQALKIIGLSSAKKITVADLLIRIYHKDIIEKILHNIKNNIKKTDIEFEFKDFNYDYRWLRLIIIIENNYDNIKIYGTIQDINVFKKLQLDLFAKNQQLNSILNEMKEVVWSYNLKNFKLQFITPSVFDVYGKPIKYFEEEFKNWEKFVHPDDQHIITKIYKDLGFLGAFNERYRIIDANGNLKYIRHQGKLILDINKKKERIDGVIIDRTQQRLAELKIEYEEKFRNLLLLIASKLIEITFDQIPIVIQDSLAQMGEFVGADRVYVFDYNLDNKTFSNTYEWFNDGIKPEINNFQNIPLEKFLYLYNKLQQNEIISIYNVNELSNSDGLKQILVTQNIQSIVLIPLFDNNSLFGFVGFDYIKNKHQSSYEEIQLLNLFAKMLSGVYQRIKWETKLLHQEQKYRNIITSIQLGFIEINNDLEIVFGNKIFELFSGYSEKEWSKLSFHQFLGMSNLNNNIDEFSNGELFEFKIKTKHKDTKWILMSVTESNNDLGEKNGYIALFLDISKEKTTQKDLIEAKKKAEKAAKAKDTFLTNMSHEIRTPINIMMGIFRILKEKISTDELIELIKKGETNAEYLLSIINAILDKNKIEESGVEINLQSFNLKNLSNSLELQFRNLANQQNNRFEISLNTSDIELFSDLIKIKQVLVNLLSNAFKFTKNGEINLIIKEISKNEDFAKVYFEVNDNGVGINKKFIKELFNKFTQENNDLNIINKGSGLGLSIANDIVKALGGNLNVDSELNVGSKFYFTLNIKICPSNLMSFNNSSEILIPQTNFIAKILLVEDNEMNRFIAKESLKKLNCEIWEAENGKIAIEMIKKINFDVILMDIQMPVMDGIECTKLIRQKLKLKTPIIAFTANAFTEEGLDYQKIGMDYILIKPYDEIKFLNAIVNSLPQKVKIDFSFLDKITNNNAVLKKEMIDLFIKVTHEAVVNLKTAIKNSDVEKIKKITHKVKAPLQQLKVKDTFNSINFIENYNSKKIEPQLLSEINNIIQTINSTHQEIENIC